MIILLHWQSFFEHFQTFFVSLFEIPLPAIAKARQINDFDR